MTTSAVSRSHKNFINGEWVPARRGSTFENRNPANTGELVGIFPASTQEDVNDAVDAAKAAFREWRLYPAPRRAEILYRAAETLVKRKEDLARDMTREMGKPLAETRGDVQEAIDMTYYMAGEGRRLFGQTVPSELPNKFAMSVRDPLGVVGMITPWNFPMAIPSWKIMPALVCGNTVVIKPAEDTPLSTYNLVQILIEAGLPPGVLNIVTGMGPDAGGPLITHPDVAAVSFTGSTETGRIVSQACAPTFKPCHLEMGGKNILIVMDDANVELAVEGAVWAGFGTTGQRCTAASRVAVHTKIYREFLNLFAERTKKLKLGDGLDPETEVGPVVNETQLQTVMKYVEIGKSEGAKVVAGGRRAESGNLAHGWFHEPTIFADTGCKDEDRAGRNFRPRGGHHPVFFLGRRHRHCQQCEIRAFGFDLHAQCESGLPSDARSSDRNRLCERTNHRSGNPASVRRDQRNRQRSSRSRDRRDRFLFRVENAVRRLFRPSAARPDRYSVRPPVAQASACGIWLERDRPSCN